MFKKVNILDDRFDVKESVVDMYRGAGDIAINQYNVVGQNPNNNNSQFNIPLSSGSWLDPKGYLDYQFTVTLQYQAINANIAANTVVFNALLDISTTDYPFQTGGICGVCDMSINNKQIQSIDMNRYGKILLELFRKKKDNLYAEGPSCPEDFYANMNDAYLTVASSAASLWDASSDRIPNGAFNNITIVGGTYNNGANNLVVNAAGTTASVGAGAAWAQDSAGQITFQVTGREPVIIPPFNFTHKKEECLFGVSNLTLNLNFNQPTIFRAFRQYNPAKTSANVQPQNTSSNFTMNSISLTLKTYQTPNMPGFMIPAPKFVKQFHQIYVNSVQHNNASFTNVAGNKIPLVKLTNAVSSGMPSRIVLWADKPNEKYAPNNMKYYYTITNLVIGIGTKQNMLSTFNVNDLYELSKDAGLHRNYIAYSGSAVSISTAAPPVSSIVQLVGSPIILIPGVSFPLNPETTTNSNGTFTFNFTAELQCNGTQDAGEFPLLYAMFVYDTWLSIDTTNLSTDVIRCPVEEAVREPREELPMITDEQVNNDLETGGAMMHNPRYSKYRVPMKKQNKLLSRIKY